MYEEDEDTSAGVGNLQNKSKDLPIGRTRTTNNNVVYQENARDIVHNFYEL